MNKTKTVTVSLLIVAILATTAIIYLTQTGTSQPTYLREIYSPTLPSENQKVVCIVFDDGWKSQLEAVQILALRQHLQ